MNDSGVIFKEDPRGYWFNDLELHGITSFIGSMLFPNKYTDVPNWILEKAAERGTKIHDTLHEVDKTGRAVCEVGEDYLKLKKENNLEVLDSEYLVTDYDFFATAIDKVVKDGDSYRLVEVKNTAKLDIDYISWQLSIGAYLFYCVNPFANISGAGVVWTRDMSYHDVPLKDLKDVKQFLKCAKEGEVYDVIPTDSKQAIAELIEVQNLIDEIDEALDYQVKKANKLKEVLKEEMKKNEVKRWDTEEILVTYIAESERVTLDSKKIKEEQPDIFEKYKKVSNIKDSVRIKIK